MTPTRDLSQMDRLVEVGLDEVAARGMSATPTAIQLSSAWWMVRSLEQTIPNLVVQTLEQNHQKRTRPRNIIVKFSPWAGAVALGGLVVEVVNRLLK